MRHGCLFALALVAMLMSSGGAARGRDSGLDRWDGLIAEASRRFDIPEAWIRAVMQAESRSETKLDGRPITSPAGAMGLMQIMPETWAYLRDRYGLGADPYDPHDNILAGTAFLGELYRKYGYPNLFAAYSAGPARLDALLQGRVPLPRETRDYLAEIVGPGASVSSGSTAVNGGLFFALHAASPEPSATNRGALFVVLRTQ